MARLAKTPKPSSPSIRSSMRGSAPPSSPPSAFQASPLPEVPQTPSFHPRARPLSKLSLNIFRLLRNHPSFHQEDENWRTRLGLYKLVQQIVESVVDAVDKEPLMFLKKERRKKEDGQEVAMELGLGELGFADKVSFQSPVEDAGREYFTSGRSPTKAKLPKPKRGKSKSTALGEANLNSFAICNTEHLTGGLDKNSEVGSEKSLFKETSTERNASKASTTGRAKRQATTKTVQAVIPKGSNISETVSPDLEQEEELQQHIVPERATRIRRGITSRATAVLRSPIGKNTWGTRADAKANLPEEGNVAPKGVISIKRAIPLKRPIQELPEATSPISQKTGALPSVKSRKIVLGNVPNEAVEIIPQTRTLRSSKRLAGLKGGVEEKAKGPLRSINKELQISSEAVTEATNGEVDFNFRRLSGEACIDSTPKNGNLMTQQAADATRRLSPIRNGNVANSKGMGSNHNRRAAGPALLEPTTLRRSSRSTKGVQIQATVPSKGRK